MVVGWPDNISKLVSRYGLRNLWKNIRKRELALQHRSHTSGMNSPIQWKYRFIH
jgi:hypothetical protein